MYLVDTHQHLWDLNQFPYSWCAGIPKLNRSFSLADYRAEIADAVIPVGKTVFMECDVDEPHALAEARAVQALADSHPLIAGLIASCRPEADSAAFRAHLDALTELPLLRGLRRILHTSPDELSQSDTFAQNLRLLPDYGLTFDLCVLARQLPLARALIKRCPDVTFILDHCGVPDVKAQALDPWRDDYARLAELPNVSAKISGIVAYADPDHWTPADLKPFVDHVIASFGWDRIVWGGDWPVCTLSSPLAGWINATAELTASATADQRAAFFHRNAERLYRV